MSGTRLFRDGLKEVLQKSRISVVGEAHDIPDLLASNTQADTDLVICHLTSDPNPKFGLNLVDGIRRHFACAKVVVLADACDKSLLSSFVCADVNAILLTNISSETLQRSLELVLFDHRMFSAEIMSLITDNAVAKPSPNRLPTKKAAVRADAKTIPVRPRRIQAVPPITDASDPHLAVPLSKREHQIINCLVCGMPNKSIARELNIAEATVKVYVKGLLRKIKATNRTQVAIWALQQSHLFNADRVDNHMEALGA